ncbi:MAG: riboflavin kinase [Veillonella parvula]
MERSNCTIYFLYIRGEVKFNNLQDLIDQMKIDEEQAPSYFS